MKKTIGLLATIGLVAAGVWKKRGGHSPRPQSRAGGMTLVRSSHDFEATSERLLATLEGNDDITFVFTFDHAAEASEAGLDIPPTRLVLFSSPALGVALSARAQTAGLDLPHRFLIWQDEEVVWIGWNDPRYLAQRHGIEAPRETLDSLSELLEGIATSVASE